MENVVGVEEARRTLGRLIRRIVETGEQVIITRRAREKVVLMNYEEYKKLRELAAEVSAAKVSEALARIRTAVREAGLSAGVVDDALREVRSR
ncbi:MAG: type II toxin-antitoxin system Phd/YefM family antitoxin [Bacillota bacterium]